MSEYQDKIKHRVGYLIQMVGYLFLFLAISLFFMPRYFPHYLEFLGINNQTTPLITPFTTYFLIGIVAMVIGIQLRPIEFPFSIPLKVSSERKESQKVIKVIICSNCTAENEATAVFCNKCGSRLKKT